METTQQIARIPGRTILAMCPPAAFGVSLLLLLTAASEPGLEGLQYIAIGLIIDMFAVPVALLCLIYTIIDLRRRRANDNRAALWLALAGNAVTLLLPAATALYAMAR
jgi:hypothetical protein